MNQPPAIPGLVLTGANLSEPPTLLVLSAPKAGKSALATTLVNWPSPGNQPLVLAADATGPDSCAQLGFRIYHIKIKDQLKENPEASFTEKLKMVVASVEYAFRSQGAGSFFTSLVIDCASTMTQMLFNDKAPNVRDKRQAYGHIWDVSNEMFWRLTNLGVPTIWLSWLADSYVDPDTNRNVMGAADMTGQKFTKSLAGRAHNILYLEKVKMGPNTPGADVSGYVRRLHTRPYNNVDCSGRFALPEPMEANLGLVLQHLTGKPTPIQISAQHQPGQPIPTAPMPQPLAPMVQPNALRPQVAPPAWPQLSQPGPPRR